MTDMLKDASAWLEARCGEYRTSTVEYRRGEDTVDVDAEVGRTEFDIDSGRAVLESWESRDYLIAAADLVLDGAVTLPRRGDRIAETIGTDVVIYQVMAPAGEPPWRYSDAYGLTLRIHTKKVDTE